MAGTETAHAEKQAYSGTDATIAYDRTARALSEASRLKPTAVLKYGNDIAQEMEIYCPQDALPADSLPVLMFLHGGAWIAGGLHWLRFMAEAVIAQPAIFVAVTYRFAPDHKWPIQLQDGIDALRLVQTRISGYGGDASRLVIAGHSAGGHIAAMAVLSGKADPVSACMPISSPMDLRYGRVSSEIGRGRVYRYLLKAPEDDGDASPICKLDCNTTPFHLTWGENDFEHIRSSCNRMYERLDADGQCVSRRIVPGAEHFDTHLQLHNAYDSWYRNFQSLVGLSRACAGSRSSSTLAVGAHESKTRNLEEKLR